MRPFALILLLALTGCASGPRAQTSEKPAEGEAVAKSAAESTRKAQEDGTSRMILASSKLEAPIEEDEVELVIEPLRFVFTPEGIFRAGTDQGLTLAEVTRLVEQWRAEVDDDRLQPVVIEAHGEVGAQELEEIQEAVSQGGGEFVVEMSP